MKTSRRNIIKNIGLTGLAAFNFPAMPTAANSFHLSKKSDEEKSLTILFQGDSISDGDRSRNNDWIWDGVHPIPARHELIARRWIKEVSKS